MKLQGKHIIDASDLSVDELNLIMDLALGMKQMPKIQQSM